MHLDIDLAPVLHVCNALGPSFGGAMSRVRNKHTVLTLMRVRRPLFEGAKRQFKEGIYFSFCECTPQDWETVTYSATACCPFSVLELTKTKKSGWGSLSLLITSRDKSHFVFVPRAADNHASTFESGKISGSSDGAVNGLVHENTCLVHKCHFQSFLFHENHTTIG